MDVVDIVVIITVNNDADARTYIALDTTPYRTARKFQTPTSRFVRSMDSIEVARVVQ